MFTMYMLVGLVALVACRNVIGMLLLDAMAHAAATDYEDTKR